MNYFYIVIWIYEINHLPLHHQTNNEVSLNKKTVMERTNSQIEITVSVRQVIDNRTANAIRMKKNAITNEYCKRGYWNMQDSIVEHKGKQYIISPGGKQSQYGLTLHDYVFENVGERITDFESFEKTNNSVDFVESDAYGVLVGTITFVER